MRKTARLGAVALLAFIVCAAGALAAPPGAAIVVPVLPAAPAMNGVVDASWAGAAKLSLDMDFTYRRAATEPTTVYVGQENGYLDIAFVATQREPLTQTQVTNGSSVQNDDYVEVLLNPQGVHGYAYTFYANPRGARYQTSSENSAYSPQWTAVGTSEPGSYSVTMRIPLNAIRNGGSSNWYAQFIRYTTATNGYAVWTYSSQIFHINDATFFGILHDVGAQHHAASRPPPRIQPYLLGEAVPRAYGGDTSRVGVDMALPVTATSSLVASLHPDYSNVEVDQQTIAPTAFARQYTEVRPFFTQAASFFNQNFSCDNCPNSLYTPAIPVFSQGYAYEGTQGPLNFGAYDAIGEDRSDDAQALGFSEENAQEAYEVALQRVAVVTPDLLDTTTQMNTGYLNQRSHLGVYLNGAEEQGTLVTDPGAATYMETGPMYVTATTTLIADYQHIGAQYDPVDGYVAQNNTNGYFSFGKQVFDFSPNFVLHDIVAQASYSTANDDMAQLAQRQNLEQVNFDFHDLLGVDLTQADEGVRVPDGELLPFDGNEIMFGYKMGTSSSQSTTTTNTPSYISYTWGPYYHGTLDAWTYLTTLSLAPPLHLTLQANEDRYDTVYPGESTNTQWLERASLDWQINRWTEFDVGVRSIIGPNLPNAYQVLALQTPGLCASDPYYPGCRVEAGNVSLAFHFLAARNEFYVVYGDPNDLSTLPAVFVKWIRYIGAEKGT